MFTPETAGALYFCTCGASYNGCCVWIPPRLPACLAGGKPSVAPAFPTLLSPGWLLLYRSAVSQKTRHVALCDIYYVGATAFGTMPALHQQFGHRHVSSMCCVVCHVRNLVSIYPENNLMPPADSETDDVWLHVLTQPRSQPEIWFHVRSALVCCLLYKVPLSQHVEHVVQMLECVNNAHKASQHKEKMLPCAGHSNKSGGVRPGGSFRGLARFGIWSLRRSS